MIRRLINILVAGLRTNRSKIISYHFAGFPALCQMPMFQKDGSFADGPDCFQVVADEQHRPAGVSNIVHLTETLLLKSKIPHGENFVDHQYFSIQVRSDCESQAHVHAARLALYGRVDKGLHFGK